MYNDTHTCAVCGGPGAVLRVSEDDAWFHHDCYQRQRARGNLLASAVLVLVLSVLVFGCVVFVLRSW